MTMYGPNNWVKSTWNAKEKCWEHALYCSGNRIARHSYVLCAQRMAAAWEWK